MVPFGKTGYAVFIQAVSQPPCDCSYLIHGHMENDYIYLDSQSYNVLSHVPSYAMILIANMQQPFPTCKELLSQLLHLDHRPHLAVDSKTNRELKFSQIPISECFLTTSVPVILQLLTIATTNSRQVLPIITMISKKTDFFRQSSEKSV